MFEVYRFVQDSRYTDVKSAVEYFEKKENAERYIELKRLEGIKLGVREIKLADADESFVVSPLLICTVKRTYDELKKCTEEKIEYHKTNTVDISHKTLPSFEFEKHTVSTYHLGSFSNGKFQKDSQLPEVKSDYGRTISYSYITSEENKLFSLPEVRKKCDDAMEKSFGYHFMIDDGEISRRLNGAEPTLNFFDALSNPKSQEFQQMVRKIKQDLIQKKEI